MAKFFKRTREIFKMLIHFGINKRKNHSQMDNSDPNHEGRISERIFRTKKMECAFFLFCGFFLILTSIVFCWFYYQKLDIANFDAYDILNDALEANELNSKGFDDYDTTTLQFKVNRAPCDPIESSTQIKRGHYFTNLYDRVFLIKAYKHQYNWKYYLCPCSIADPALNDKYQIDAFRIQTPNNQEPEATRIFHVPKNYSTFDPQANGTLTIKYISKLTVIYYYYNKTINGFSDDIRVSYEFDTPPATFEVEIHLANEYLQYDFPTLSFSMIMAVSFPLFLVGIVCILFFLWHCWSYKYILIKRAINESGLDFER